MIGSVEYDALIGFIRISTEDTVMLKVRHQNDQFWTHDKACGTQAA
jgi:hypothetical protein